MIPIGPKAPTLVRGMADRSGAARWRAGSGRGQACLAVGAPMRPPRQPLARAYLDVNCAHCHQPGGGASNSGLDLRWEQDDPRPTASASARSRPGAGRAG